MFSVRSIGRVRDNWTSLFKNKINNWHIHTLGSQKQGRSTNNFPCTLVTSRRHVVILWWDFEVTCSFKTLDWNKLFRAEHFLPVVCRVRQRGKTCSPSSRSIKKGSAVLFFALEHQCEELLRAGTVSCLCLSLGTAPLRCHTQPAAVRAANTSVFLQSWLTLLPAPESSPASPALTSPTVQPSCLSSSIGWSTQPAGRWSSWDLPPGCRGSPATRAVSKEGNSAHGSYRRGKEKACDMGKGSLGCPQ